MKIIRRIFVTILFCISYISVFAQSEYAKKLMSTPYVEVIQEDISSEIHTTKSKYFYPAIYRKYELGDTTMTLDEFRHLYYGYMYNEDYKPMVEPKVIDSLSKVIYDNGGKITENNADNVIKYLEQILQERPFSLKFLNLLVYTYDIVLKNEEKARLNSYRLNMLLETIFSSGDGITPERPWHVLYRDDAQSILGLLSANITRRVHITKDCEYYHLRDKQGNIKGYYFDFRRIYTRPIEPTSKRKMEFNPDLNPRSKKYINKNIK